MHQCVLDVSQQTEEFHVEGACAVWTVDGRRMMTMKRTNVHPICIYAAIHPPIPIPLYIGSYMNTF